MEDFYYNRAPTDAGTVKPLGVAPPEAAVYLTEISGKDAKMRTERIGQ
jgi:hypothetical protein